MARTYRTNWWLLLDWLRETPRRSNEEMKVLENLNSSEAAAVDFAATSANGEFSLEHYSSILQEMEAALNAVVALKTPTLVEDVLACILRPLRHGTSDTSAVLAFLYFYKQVMENRLENSTDCPQANPSNQYTFNDRNEEHGYCTYYQNQPFSSQPSNNETDPCHLGTLFFQPLAFPQQPQNFQVRPGTNLDPSCVQTIGVPRQTLEYRNPPFIPLPSNNPVIPPYLGPYLFQPTFSHPQTEGMQIPYNQEPVPRLHEMMPAFHTDQGLQNSHPQFSPAVSQSAGNMQFIQAEPAPVVSDGENVEINVDIIPIKEVDQFSETSKREFFPPHLTAAAPPHDVILSGGRSIHRNSKGWGAAQHFKFGINRNVSTPDN